MCKHNRLLAAVLLLTFSSLAYAQNVDVQEAWRLAEEARVMARSGEAEGAAALDLYRQALELAPDVTAIRRDYATVLGWTGEHVEAHREFGVVRAQEPKQPIWAVREMANAAFFGGGDDYALEAYDQLIAAGHYDEPVLTRRGLTLLRLGRAADAEAQYRQALGWYPDSESAAEGLGRALAAQGRFEAARTLAVTWGAEAPPDSNIRVLEAEMLAKLGRHAEAAAAFDRISTAKLEETGAVHIAEESRRLASAETNPTPPLRRQLTPRTGAADYPPATTAEALREQGVQAARAGNAQEALRYLEQSLELAPEDTESLRDYAVVLGWAERYNDALEQFDRLLAREPEQPAWARAELARGQLFADQPAAALETLDALIAEGHADLATLSRRGLALRWMGRSEEATAAYREIWQDFPDSPEGARGVVQALADRNHLADALDAAEKGLEEFPNDAELRLRQAQTLNWAGRHIQARRALEMLPPAFKESPDALQHRSLAARWASRPREAFELALSSRRINPDNREAEKLLHELSVEYGPSVSASGEVVSDSLGYSYRSTLQEASLPLSLTHRLSFLRERRSYEDSYAEPHSLDSTRYGVGWTGVLGARITANASVSSLDYGMDVGANRRLLGEASLSALVTDSVSLAGGFARVPAQTLPALQARLVANTGFASARYRPTIKLDTSARYTHRDFSGATVRQTFEYSAFYRISQRGGHKIRLGGRSQWLWHDRYTPLLWSPSFFQTQLAVVHFEGRFPGKLDYVGEVGSGFQREAGYAVQRPLATTLELARKVTPHLWLRLKGGYSNSSIERINSSRGGYRFGYVSFGLEFRPGRRG